jgi:thiosulfate/3-mercaptopyruvate sulfurtransferase
MGVRLLSLDEWQHGDARAPAAWAVVDARPREDYLAGHIPGAVHVAWEAWCAPGPAHLHAVTAQPGYWGRLAAGDDDARADARCAAELARHGLSHDRPVVVYADGAGSKGREGRIAWMLLYLGACDVLLLDGGWSAWQRAGGPLASGEEDVREAGLFRIMPQEGRRMRLDALRRAYHEGTLPLLVDSREQHDFAGRVHPYMPRMGHLPAAVLLPYERLFAPLGHYIGRDGYLGLLPPAARHVPIVTYCEVGVRAATVALLHEIYTGQVSATYDGSLMEWSLDPHLPVLTGPA